MKKIFIKNMVCPRCILAVEDVFQAHGIPVNRVELGEVTLHTEMDSAQLLAVEKDLQALGFEVLDDSRSRLIEQVKGLLIQKVQSADIDAHFSLKKYLSAHLYKDYSFVSKTFSEVEGITIEQFFLLQKIEKVKELLVYNEEPLYMIAAYLGYSSPQHLSGQFKRFTGMTTGEFRKSGGGLRKPIDQVI